jgi:hypothetical protein
METQVRTPQAVFLLPQRLIVPLFQRPYVWNEENQWEPLWGDVTRLAERYLANPGRKHQPHFLGAVVLQQVATTVGHMQQRMIIDGQQRLTTLQLLLDALHAELVHVGATSPAARIESLVSNEAPFRSKPEDRFKVWPTNRDRPAFNAVMGALPPVDHDALGFKGERMVEAHRYFSEQAREWLQAGGADVVHIRAAAVETVVRDLLQMVVIDLGADENAQEIFETLNARGAILTAADLIKNYVFQRLQEGQADVETVYEQKWKEFETGFWETEVGAGRLRYPRSSLFLNHWLIARTGTEIVAREVFDQFKRYCHDAGGSMLSLVDQLHQAAVVYRSFIDSAASEGGRIDRLALFGYRTGVMESEVIKPLVLWLKDPGLPKIPDAQFHKVLAVVESWMVRRMLVRATTKSYSKVVADLVKHLSQLPRAEVGDAVEGYFTSQESGGAYWPDDRELRGELEGLLAYRRLGRGRLRMVLEAIEDHRRGWRDGKEGLSGERVARGTHAIEHVMPRKWASHWPLGPGGSEAERDQLIHTLGNLTLITGRLNSTLSNAPWPGENGKQATLCKHDTLFVNRDIWKNASTWTEDAIRARTQELIDVIVAIWPVPEGHRSPVTSSGKVTTQRKHSVDLADLLNAGLLTAGMTLYPRRRKIAERVAILLPDGQLDVAGTIYPTPSAAATVVAERAMNGWWLFLVEQKPKRSLKDVRRQYIDSLDVDSDEDDGEDESDDGEE